MTKALEPMLGETGALVVQFVTILIVVLVMIVAGLWLFRTFFGARFGIARGKVPRLSVVDALPIDARRRLVLVRRDQFEHLLLIGGPSDIVVEQTIFRGVPLTARLRPEPAKANQQSMGGAAFPGPQVRAPIPEPVAPPPERVRRLPPEPAPTPVAVPAYSVGATPAAAFAPPGMAETEAPQPRVALPPEAPGELAEPPRSPPMRPDASRQQGNAEHMAQQVQQGSSRPVLTAVPPPRRALDERAGAPRRPNGTENGEPLRFRPVGIDDDLEPIGPPPKSIAPAITDDLTDDDWRTLDERAFSEIAETSPSEGPTPEQVSNLEQEMARLLGEIAGKRTS